MQKLAVLFLLLVATTVAPAQTRVKASEILRQINAGEAVTYTNVEIEGDLDLTDLKNSRPEGASGLFYFGGTQTFESTVKVPLTFTQCTFLGEVLAYYHVDRRNETYVAHFDRDVTFANCTFRKASEFKYSEFNGNVSFEGSTFHHAANFKYAEFSEGPSFRLARFEEGADFKYAEFPRETSFEKAVFSGRTDFKYTKFRSPLNMNGVAFRGSEDFKYTKIDGRSFTAYLLDR